MPSTANRDIIEEFAQLISAERPSAAPEKIRYVRNQTNPGRPVLCSVGKTPKPAKLRSGGLFCDRKAG